MVKAAIETDHRHTLDMANKASSEYFITHVLWTLRVQPINQFNIYLTHCGSSDGYEYAFQNITKTRGSLIVCFIQYTCTILVISIKYFQHVCV